MFFPARPSAVFAWYLLVSAGWWTTASIAIDSYWSGGGHVVGLCIWLAGAVGFWFRGQWGWLLLLALESMSLIRWIEEPGEEGALAKSVLEALSDDVVNDVPALAPLRSALRDLQ